MKYNLDGVTVRQYQPLITDSQFFSQMDERFLTSSSRGSLDRLRAIHADIQKRDCHSVLDIGCNTGFFCHALAGAGYVCTGVDSDEHSRAHDLPSVIDEAQKLAGIYFPAQGIVTAPQFLREDFMKYHERHDVVLFLSVFHHMFRRAKRDGLNIETYTEAALWHVFSLADRVLYLEMSTIFPEVRALGWTPDNVSAKLKQILGAKVKPIHTSTDAHLEPRIVFAIEK